MRRARLTAGFAWAAWATSLAVAGAVSARYARRYPFSDDWGVVRVITGREDFSLGYLWEQDVVHRIPVPKLLMLFFDAIGGVEPRVAVAFVLLIFAGTSATAIVVMKRVRGHTTWTDALFPLVFFALWQWSLTWSFVGVHSGTVAVASTLGLLVITRFGLDVPARWLWAVVALVVVLLGCATHGLAFATGLIAWVVLAGFRLRRTSRRSGTALVVAGAVLPVGAGLYFVGYHAPPTASSSPAEVVISAFRLGTVVFGPRATGFWPATAGAVVVVLGATAVLLVMHVLQRVSAGARRDDAIALACFGVSCGAILLALGLGRGRVEWEAYHTIQYSALVVPVACWCYVTWAKLGGDLGRSAAAVLALGAFGAYALNVNYMRARFSVLDRQETAFAHDLCRLSPRALAAEHPYFLFVGPSPRELNDVAKTITVLKRERSGHFDC